MDRLIVVLALACGCVPTSYSYTPSTRGEVARQPGPSGCELTVLHAPPEEDFEEVGTFDHYNGAVPGDDAAFKKAVASLVCDVGGHAVIVKDGYKTATVIKYARGFHL